MVADFFGVVLVDGFVFFDFFDFFGAALFRFEGTRRFEDFFDAVFLVVLDFAMSLMIPRKAASCDCPTRRVVSDTDVRRLRL